MLKQILSPLLLVATVATASASFAHDKDAHPLRTLPVTASAEIKVAPDKAVITASVITEGSDAVPTAQDNAAKMQVIYNALLRMGITGTDIKTSQVSLTPRYDYSSRKKPRITGYEARNTVNITTLDLVKVGPIVDTLVRSGANDVSNVQFTLQDPDGVELRVLDAAIRKARAKAQAMASSAGVSLGQLQTLSTGGSGYSPFNQDFDEIIVTGSRKTRGSASAPPATPISYGDQTVRTTVNLVYEIK